MAYDKVVDSASLDSKLTQVADAIRTKGNTSADLQFPSGFISAIQAIQTGTELKIIVSVTSGATVTATKGSLSVSGTSVNNSCTLTVPEGGEWTVSATLNGNTSVVITVDIIPSVAAELPFVDLILNNNSWEKIRQISDEGTAENYWSIGDRKAVTLNGTVGKLSLSNVTTYAFIIGFNHNSSVEGANRIHFQLAKAALSDGKDVCLCDNSYGSFVSTTGYFSINSGSSNTTSGGWKKSKMRTNICGTSLSSYSGTIIAVIPAELRSAIKSVTKYTDNTGGGSTAASNITATTDYFFLLSEFEVFGSISYANSNEASKQAQYAYYSAGTSKIKYKHDATSTAVVWSLRSPRSADAYFFVYVNPNGKPTTEGSNISYGFAPGFCV